MRTPAESPTAHVPAAQLHAGSDGGFRGLAAALVIFIAWLLVLAYSWFVLDRSETHWLWQILVLTVSTFTFTGLFITAHEAMHGLVTPKRPRLNRWIGRVAIFLYAGFSYDRFLPKHHEHHDHTATDKDPDFHDGRRTGFWAWYLHFMWTHFSLRPFALYNVVFIATWYGGGSLLGFLVSWPLPALLASLQLFYFGTYLPHREPAGGYNDLRSRSNRYPEWLSFLTCYHFGYHYEHHLKPWVPWWRLPATRRELAKRGLAG
jgi:beta-carotene/zeaxanthin 4-ketolase